MLNELVLIAATLAAIPAEDATGFLVERVSTRTPFPRGLQLVDGQLYAISRGRVREYGGVSAAVDDQAGTLFVIDPNIAEEFHPGDPSPAVRENGRVLAAPTEPPFRLWDRSANPPWSDRQTDRPYCGLSWHPGTQSFYICAFSGIDRDEKTGKTFSKNLADAILRYDLRTSKWYEVERHDIDKGGLYPHQDPRIANPPHGWLNGPNNCLALGDSLYAVSKDNSRLVRYDLRALEQDPEAGAPASEPVFEEYLDTKNVGPISMQGHSALAYREGWLYVASRTSGHVVRLKLDEQKLPTQKRHVELVGLFDPYDPSTRKSSNLTDMSFGPDGHLYLTSAQPARCHRFLPDPKAVHDARAGKSPPWFDLAALTGNAQMKSENILVDGEGRVYITSGDAYAYHAGAGGVIWRVSRKKS